jgi:hypothetical protein
MNRSPSHHSAVERLYGATRDFVVGHLHEPKPFALPGSAVMHHACLGHFTIHTEQLRQLLISGGVGEIPHVHANSHTGSLNTLRRGNVSGPRRQDSRPLSSARSDHKSTHSVSRMLRPDMRGTHQSGFWAHLHPGDVHTPYTGALAITAITTVAHRIVRGARWAQRSRYNAQVAHAPGGRAGTRATRER